MHILQMQIKQYWSLEDYLVNKKRETMKKEILYFLVALLGGMLFGYDTAVINGAMPFFTAYFQLTDAMVGWSVSSGLLGCILGAAFASYPADWAERNDEDRCHFVLSVVFGNSFRHELYIVCVGPYPWRNCRRYCVGDIAYLCLGNYAA